jgi:hypothetical protein
MINGAGSDTRAPLVDGLYPPSHAPIAHRNGYWLPMLLFGALILAAPLCYQPFLGSGEYFWDPTVASAARVSGLAFAPLQQFGTSDASLGDPMSVALYWFCVVMFGPMAALLWYHRQARRHDEPPQTGWYLLYASVSLALYVVLFPVIEFVSLHLTGRTADEQSAPTSPWYAVLAVTGFVLGIAVSGAATLPRRAGHRLSNRRWTVTGFGVLLTIASAAAIEFLAYLHPRDSYGSLLVIGVGLLALSLVERGWACSVIAVLFTASALVANLVSLRPLCGRLGIVAPQGVTGASAAMGTAFANLVLPGAILVLGGLFGLLADRRARLRRSGR